MPAERATATRDPDGRFATAGILLALGLWPVGLTGAFFLFFGDGDDPDPRDFFVPFFFGAMFLGALIATGLAAASWRRQPWKCIATAVVAAPWLLLGGYALVNGVVELLKR
jgi:hypothetical protein